MLLANKFAGSAILGSFIQIWDRAGEQTSPRGIPHLNLGSEPGAIDIATQVETQ